MKMAEAKAKLMELAGDEYHSISYSLTDNGKGHVSQECKVYVNDVGSFEATHWEIALLQLERAMHDGNQGKITEDLPTSKPEKAKSK